MRRGAVSPASSGASRLLATGAPRPARGLRCSEPGPLFPRSGVSTAPPGPLHPEAFGHPVPPPHLFLPPVYSPPIAASLSLPGALSPHRGSMSAPALPHIPLSTQHKDPGRGQGPCPPAPTVAGEEEALPGGREQQTLGVTLTDRLMAARSLPGLGETMCPVSCSEELPALQTIRLDREDICTIGRLGSLPGIHSLYLQRNRIEKIENLDCFPNLQFLCLAGNCIRKVENLRPLQHLRFLDLSQNQIQTLDADELPRSLRLLDLTGNECTHQPGYRWVREPPLVSRGGGESKPPNPVSSSVVFNTSPRPRKSESASAQVGQGGLWCFSQHAAVGWGNVCCLFAACRELVLGALPHLLQLDAQPLHSCGDPAPG
eukprot:XP_024999892.1 leucine-rich repeat-containing protein 46 isoform X1 [Gallus gallus]